MRQPIIVIFINTDVIHMVLLIRRLTGLGSTHMGFRRKKKGQCSASRVRLKANVGTHDNYVKLGM